MKKVSVYIDGFNLYHAIDNLNRTSSDNKHYLKWVDLRSLSQKFINRAEEAITEIVYFSAIADFHRDPAVPERHLLYIEALKSVGVDFVPGKFKKKKDTYEEKETDVNIALAILENAYERKSDKILLITNDSDISPAVRMARAKNNALKVNIITPPLVSPAKPNYDLIQSAGDVTQVRHKNYRKVRVIQESHLQKSLFAADTEHNGKIIVRPLKYTPPHDLVLQTLQRSVGA